jgi:hypothetical protein
MADETAQERSSITVQAGKWILSATGSAVILIVLMAYGFFSFQRQHEALTKVVSEMRQSLDDVFIGTVWNTLTDEQKRVVLPVVQEKLERKLKEQQLKLDLRMKESDADGRPAQQ